MNNQSFQNVQALLELRGCIHLIDSLEFIPAHQIEAVSAMAEALKEREQNPTEVAARVEHDISGFLENETSFLPYCKDWLKAEKEDLWAQ